MTTHVLMIIDASGSMGPFRDDTIGGFHTYLNELAGDGGDYQVSVTLFSSRNYIHTHAANLPPADAALRLDGDSYRTVGMTALLDATGKTITEFIDTHHELGDDDKVIVVSITDGQENDSTDWTFESLPPLIKTLTGTGKWQFIYLAQGLDGWEQASRMGYNANSYVGTQTVSGETIAASYNTAAVSTRQVSRTGDVGDVAAVLAEALGEDNIHRAGR